MPSSSVRTGVGCLLFVLAAAVPSPALNASSPCPTITWSACPPGTPSGLDCGSIDVPLAYQPASSVKADGALGVTLALTRLRSTGNATAPGNLFFNPGGPGVSAIDTIAEIAAIPTAGLPYLTALRDAYNIIALDPRGVGHSTPVQCDPAIWNERTSTFVNDTNGYNALLDHNRRLGASCESLTGPLLNHLDTTHVAKDFEVVRQAIGTRKFSLLAQSYGSQIGAQYAELFPDSVGRMALDAIVDHTQSETSSLLAESETYETTLNKFFQWCDTTSTCALYGKNTSQVFDDMVATAEASPIPALGCSANGTAASGVPPCQPSVTGEDIGYNIQTLGYVLFVENPAAPDWTALGAAIATAAQGDATALSTPLATTQNFTSFAELAIGCQDWAHNSRSATDIEFKLLMARTFAPRTAGTSQGLEYQTRCLGWPAPASNTQRYLNAETVRRAPPMLLVNSQYDPSCSIAWAVNVRAQLPTAVGIVRLGAGHTSYFLQGDTAGAINAFLIDGTLPADGSTYQS